MTDSHGQHVGDYIKVLAGTIVIFIGMRLAAPVVGPLLLVIFFSILSRPIYEWLLRRKLSSSLAISLLALVLVGVTLLLMWIIVGSLHGLTAQLEEYKQLLSARFGALGETFERLNVTGAAAPSAAIGEFLMRNVLSIIGIVISSTMSFFYVVIGILFLVVEGPKMWSTVQSQVGEDNPVTLRLNDFAPEIIHYFGLRTYLNFLTGLGSGIGFFLLGVDFAALWGVLVFLLSYVPYIGLFLAGVPPVVIAFAKYGLARALIVVAMIVVVNIVLENVAMPRMAGRDFQLSAFVVYASFFFWTWLIGPPGALLAAFLTLLLVRLLDSFGGSRWLAAMMAPSRDTIVEGTQDADSITTSS